MTLSISVQNLLMAVILVWCCVTFNCIFKPIIIIIIYPFIIIMIITINNSN